VTLPLAISSSWTLLVAQTSHFLVEVSATGGVSSCTWAMVGLSPEKKKKKVLKLSKCYSFYNSLVRHICFLRCWYHVDVGWYASVSQKSEGSILQWSDLTVLTFIANGHGQQEILVLWLVHLLVGY